MMGWKRLPSSDLPREEGDQILVSHRNGMRVLLTRVPADGGSPWWDDQGNVEVDVSAPGWTHWAAIEDVPPDYSFLSEMLFDVADRGVAATSYAEMAGLIGDRLNCCPATWRPLLRSLYRRLLTQA